MSFSEKETKDKIRNFIKTNFMILNSKTLNDDDSFLDNGIIDSTGILEVLDFLQSDFGIEVEDSEMLPINFDSISRISEYVKRKKA